MDQKISQSVEKLEARIVEQPAFTLVGMVLRTTPDSQKMHQLWIDFDGQLERVRNRTNRNDFYGAMDHFDMQTGELDYMAGVEVQAGQAAPEGMVAWEVPAQTYAVFETTLPQIGKTFETIYGTWLPASDLERADGPEFEYYGAEFSPQDPASKMSIWIPVKEK